LLYSKLWPLPVRATWTHTLHSVALTVATASASLDSLEARNK
jgi:hypothetical protein